MKYLKEIITELGDEEQLSILVQVWDKKEDVRTWTVAHGPEIAIKKIITELEDEVEQRSILVRVWDKNGIMRTWTKSWDLESAIKDGLVAKSAAFGSSA